MVANGKTNLFLINTASVYSVVRDIPKEHKATKFIGILAVGISALVETFTGLILVEGAIDLYRNASKRLRRS